MRSDYARAVRLAAPFVLVVLAGCETPPALRPPVNQPEKLRSDAHETAASPPPNPWADCQAGIRATGDAKADLARLTKACANGQSRMGEMRTGSQGENDPVSRFAFSAGGANRCYRVYAVGGAGVVDLDVLVRGTNGEPLVRDTSHGPIAVVPGASALCLPDDGVYTLDVGVVRGRGDFAVELWGPLRRRAWASGPSRGRRPP